VHGEMKALRAYYYCGRCKQSFLPFDDVLGLVDEISPGLRPLVCLAGRWLRLPTRPRTIPCVGLCVGPPYAGDF
jgi:hypothetical protein